MSWKRFADRMSIWVCIVLLGASAGAALAAAPEVGRPAPDFRFVGVVDGVQDTWTLSDYLDQGRADPDRADQDGVDAGSVSERGSGEPTAERRRKRGVVIAWFPKAFTPG